MSIDERRLAVQKETMASQPEEIQPQVIARGDGAPMWFLGALTFITATAETTRGAFGLLEQVIPAGFGSPFHVHHAEDEAFYVLEGQLTFFSQGKKSQVGPGGYIFGPRDIPHGFRVDGTTPARVLLLTTPAGGFENFVREMSEPAHNSNEPPAGPPDMEKLMSLAAAYKIDILGPLPE
jgi:quercetin dioxygenase-like cupin family protein